VFAKYLFKQKYFYPLLKLDGATFESHFHSQFLQSPMCEYQYFRCCILYTWTHEKQLISGFPLIANELIRNGKKMKESLQRIEVRQVETNEEKRNILSSSGHFPESWLTQYSHCSSFPDRNSLFQKQHPFKIIYPLIKSLHTCINSTRPHRISACLCQKVHVSWQILLSCVSTSLVLEN